MARVRLRDKALEAMKKKPVQGIDKENSEVAIPAADSIKGRNASRESIKKIPIRVISPARCKPWKYHNRDSAWLNEKNCADTIESIKKNGQQDPGLVRELNDDPDYDFEIIYGVRRWFSCKTLGIDFKARLTDASDRECMVLMHVENADSQDISDFERACSFLEQLRSGEFSGQKDLAVAMNMSTSNISKLILAAELYDYDWIREALPSKVNIPIKKASELSSLLKNNLTLKTVRKRLNDLTKEEELSRWTPSKILNDLVLVAKGGDVLAKAVSTDIPGMKVKVDSRGKLSLNLEPKVRRTSAEIIKKELSEIIDDYLNL